MLYRHFVARTALRSFLASSCPKCKALAVQNTMIDASDFRNKKLSSLTIKYEWDGSLHSAFISVVDNEGVESIFKISGLTEYYIYEDFGCTYISNCKLLETEHGFYLCLDPYDELSCVADLEKDSMWFIGSTLVKQ